MSDRPPRYLGPPLPRVDAPLIVGRKPGWPYGLEAAENFIRLKDIQRELRKLGMHKEALHIGELGRDFMRALEWRM